MLIGTQMVAKGHDFPDVTLGVVLDADATLRFPDFRAEERTFALIAQLAGRVGRGGEGRVLVQTIAPEARSIVHAARHDSDGFLAGELDRRRGARLPALLPPDQDRLLGRGAAARARARRRAALCGELELPAPRRPVGGAGGAGRARPGDAVSPARARAPGARGQGRPSAAPPCEAAGEAVRRVAAARAHAGVSFSVDVDPQ